MERSHPVLLVFRRGRSLALLTLVAALLMIVSAWNVTASTALNGARAAYARGDLPGCLRHALDHLGRRPWSREAVLLAAHSFSRLDFADLAEPYFRRAGALSQNDLQLRAYGLARGRDPEASIPVFEEILAHDPENVTALRRMAAVLIAQNKTTQLLDLADRLSRIPAGKIIGVTMRAVVHHNDSNPQAAVAAFEQVLELDPGLREMPLPQRLFWGEFAADLIESGRTRDAEAYLNKAATAASDPALMNQLGGAYFLEGELDLAEACFRQAVAWGPNEYEPYLNLAKLAQQRRQPKEAIEHLKKARLLAPGSTRSCTLWRRCIASWDRRRKPTAPGCPQASPRLAGDARFAAGRRLAALRALARGP